MKQTVQKTTPLRLFKWLPALLISVLFSSCVTTSVVERTNTIMSPDKSLSKQRTYSWYQPKPTAPATYGKDYSPELHQHLTKAIEAELAEKGYRKTSVNPDLLLAYDVSVSVPVEKDVPELYGNGFGYSYAYMGGYRYTYGNTQMPGYRAVDLFKEGTVIVDLIDPKTNQLLWRGWTEGAISNFNAGYGKVSGIVRNIISKLPAASGN
ncbi:DUF4136 domain-containing protein [Pontibacter roseus]|uniref:DUF4136 domain-containing protein n=1 Tax=Pontibacter roseus TaxID=336989 RepID=UPI00038294E3|nr:DUF4136 domain-containing protein [Pontibacter roseus]